MRSFGHHRVWSANEDAILRSCYEASRPMKVTARELGRSVGSVTGRAFRLNLEHPQPQGAGRTRIYTPRARKLRVDTMVLDMRGMFW